MEEIKEISKTKEALKKTQQPVLNPRQLMVFLMVQIIGVISGLAPVFVGEKFNVYFFIIMFVVDNVCYACIMTLRSAKPGVIQESSMGIIGKFVTNLVKSMLTKQDKKELLLNIEAETLLEKKERLEKELSEL